MTSILDNLEKIKKLDKNKGAASIEALPLQMRQVLKDSLLIKIPREYGPADGGTNHVVINGMGGSNLGAGIVKAVFLDELKVPITIAPGYEVPAFVDKNTLFILSSYSGNTEETLSVYKEVKKRDAKIMAIAGAHGGRLEKLMIKENIPGYIFKTENNPSGSPRLGIGYAVLGLAVLLAKAGMLSFKSKELEEIIEDLEIWNHELRPGEKTGLNIAKQIALQLKGKTPIVVGAEFLTGNLRVLRNQFCENSKNFSGYLTLPELNHYAMEGLANPSANRNNLIFFFIDSKFYHPRVQKRSELTKEIVHRNKLKFLEYGLKGETKLEQALVLLQLGTWVSFYLGILNNENPVTNPWVDWFKKELTT